jgi:hypothetical protein
MESFFAVISSFPWADAARDALRHAMALDVLLELLLRQENL